jgi:hypothetical protein
MENKALVKQSPKMGRIDPYIAPMIVPTITFIVGFE